MAAVSVDSVQFYHPPNKSIHANRPRQRYRQHESAAAATFAHSTAKVQDCNRTSAQSDDGSNDDYPPPLEEVFQTRFPTKASAKPFKPERNQQQVEKSASDATGIHIDHTKPGLGDRPGGSQDQPVVIEDNEPDSTDAKIEAGTLTSADTESGSPERDTTLRGIGSAQDSTSESSVSVDPPALNVWYDVEDGRYIAENELLPSLELGEQEGSPAPPAHDDPHCEDRDRLSVVSLSCSPRPPRRSIIELSPHLNIRQSQSDIAHRRSEERRDASRPDTHTPDVGKEKPTQQDAKAVTEEPRELQVEEELEEEEEEEEEMTAVVEGRAVQEEEDELDEQAVEESQEGQGVGTVDNPEDEDHSRDTDDEEEEEDFRPAKRRKLPPVSAKEALEPAHEHNPKLDIGRPCRRTSATFIQIEMDDRHVQTEDRDTLPPSRSPSAAAESGLAAEYEEWPLHGFLKRTRIGSTTSFNLEFHLSHVPEHLELLGLSEALRSSIGTSPQHMAFHSAAAHSNTRSLQSRRPMKRLPWTKEEDETLVKMKEEDGASWEEISEALPCRTPGAIQVHYSTKLGGAGSRIRQRPRGLLSTEV